MVFSLLLILSCTNVQILCHCREVRGPPAPGHHASVSLPPPLPHPRLCACVHRTCQRAGGAVCSPVRVPGTPQTRPSPPPPDLRRVSAARGSCEASTPTLGRSPGRVLLASRSRDGAPHPNCEFFSPMAWKLISKVVRLPSVSKFSTRRCFIELRNLPYA